MNQAIVYFNPLGILGKPVIWLNFSSQKIIRWHWPNEPIAKNYDFGPHLFLNSGNKHIIGLYDSLGTLTQDKNSIMKVLESHHFRHWKH